MATESTTAAASTLGVAECVGALACSTVVGTGVALLCCSDDPIEGDPRAAYSRRWQTDMMGAPLMAPDWFCCAVLCEPCALYSLRTWALGGDTYRCCQGYFDGCCFQAGSYGDEGNPCCLVLEVVICPCFAVQATRFYVMDTRNIMPSGTDNKLVRFSNFLQVLACLCRTCDLDGADIISFYADFIFCTLLACMSAQVAAELRAEKAGRTQAPSRGVGAPRPQVIARYPSAGRNQVAVLPVAQQPVAYAGYPGQQPGYPVQQPGYSVQVGYPAQQGALPVAVPVAAMAPQPVVMARPVGFVM